MPGLLDNYGGAGLLGNLGQAQQGFGSRDLLGSAATQQEQESLERQEYERAKAQGFTGTFEEFKEQKRKRGSGMGGMGFMSMMNNLQPGGPMSGIGLIRNLMGGQY